MSNKIKILANQFLIVLNIFVLFFLLFSKYLVIPFWLQPIGRMHTLLLHFPIVILMLGVILGLRRFSTPTNANTLLENLADTFLLLGAILAGITVIMGLFLSREGGYSGDTLVWHKWTGAGIFVISSVMYWARNRVWYKKILAWFLGCVLVVIIIITGHFGGVLTHGENFILQPILSNIKKPLVPIEKAIVFDDLVKPIFDKKCASCHNLNKQKGELSFADTLSILKGGKNGKLYVSGDPQVSLLFQRIHLPIEDEKHMPPSSKPQLSLDEINLLSWWIKNKASFTQKVTDLPQEDSLKVLAYKLLSGPTAVEESYDFKPIDEAKISKLNTDYRTIRPIAKESPGLDVRIFNKDTYTVNQLEELSEIKEQVVSLSLAKLPVKNEDLKKIVMFNNLRKLDINFTEVTTNGLGVLSTLKHLQSLSLSGTKVSYSGLSQIIATLKNIKTITLWNTNLNASEIEILQKSFKNINFIQGFNINLNEQLKLNPPQVKNGSFVFGMSVNVELFHPINGTELRYTTNGKDPDSITSPIFDNKLLINNTSTIKVKAYRKGWFSSDIAVFSFIKNSFVPDSVILLTQLNRVHQAEGANTFFNKILGTFGANSPAWANYWAGVRDNDLVAMCFFNKPINLSAFGMHYMVEEQNGIYPPLSVEVWGGNDAKNLKLLTILKPRLPLEGEEHSMQLLEGVFKSKKVSCIKIIAKPNFKINPKNNNKGKSNAKNKAKNKTKKKGDSKAKTLLLIDEMFLN